MDYPSWEQVRYRQPPGDLTHEEWWLALKYGRTAMQRQLPLRMISGSRFWYALPDTVLRLTDQITRSASGRIAMAEQITNSATRDRYVVSSLIEEAITSSQMEGASTSRQVAKEMLRTGRPSRTRSERMILNNYLAMQHVAQLGDVRLTPAIVCELHRIVTEGTLDDPDQAGRLQSDPDPKTGVAVFGDDHQVIHSPPPVDQLEERLEELCRFVNGDDDRPYIPPVLRALAVHFMVGYDHYFEDGNGRTARALFYWVMLREGYWLTEFLSISRILKQAPAQYARSFVLTEQDDGDLTYFFLHHLDVLARSIAELDDYLERKVSELRETRVALAATPGEYNHRQLALLELALKDPTATFSAISHSRSHNVSDETARQDLGDLTRRGLLARSKDGRRNVWRPHPDLPDLIRDGHH